MENRTLFFIEIGPIPIESTEDNIIDDLFLMYVAVAFSYGEAVDLISNIIPISNILFRIQELNELDNEFLNKISMDESKIVDLDDDVFNYIVDVLAKPSESSVAENSIEFENYLIHTFEDIIVDVLSNTLSSEFDYLDEDLCNDLCFELTDSLSYEWFKQGYTENDVSCTVSNITLGFIDSEIESITTPDTIIGIDVYVHNKHTDMDYMGRFFYDYTTVFVEDTFLLISTSRN